MAYPTRDRAPLLDRPTQAAIERRGRELLGLCLIGAGLLAAMMLWSYSPEDPNWMLVSDAPVQNWLGSFGASVAHPLMMVMGHASWGIPLLCGAWGLRLVLHRAERRARAVFAPVFLVALAVFCATLEPGPEWKPLYGLGGLFGDTALSFALTLLPVGGFLPNLLSFAAMVWVGAWVMGVTRAEMQALGQRAAVAAVLGYAWGLKVAGQGARLSAAGLREARVRGRAAAELGAAWLAEQRARREAARAVVEEAVLPEAPSPSRVRRAAHALPPPAPAAGPRTHVMPPQVVPRPFPPVPDGTDLLAEEGEGDEAALLWDDGAEAAGWPAPGRAVAPLVAPAREAAPVGSGGFLATLLRRAKGEDEAVPPMPGGEGDRIRARIGDAIRARTEAAQARLAQRAEPVLAGAGAAVGAAAGAALAAAAPVVLPPPVLPPMGRAPVMPVARVVAPAREAVREAAPQARSETRPETRPEPARVSAPRAAAAKPAPLPVDEAVPYIAPPLDLLSDPASIQRHHLDDAALEENARALEQVLDDFGVKGEIVSVRPGPVVTMYELEPAPGLKASRVIGLADDIARNMSALSARVSTVPGRNVIGIELPNQKREKVVLREILSAPSFGDEQTRLPLALGKDIGGAPVVANLAKMPHLLIAGTTGSGKSVAINTMILSLLYRLSPEDCRLIMIDPKMLELSVYDGIPHLLSPVVTDPRKAVVALKWVVGEMEERYRKMSKMGVRNIEGYNGRVREALAAGETFSRTVQTGFDEETGDPVFETEEIRPEVLPFIVVVVDEMADLMMVAGKEIEACIQRLAQMARASGIHLIMATQRPSVDVITGTIKANFPTRISFQVTSKIDSRTILGEQGAEQLLGQGDMLYMAGGGRITRVHGPFVSDEEVEEIVTYLKTLGPPEYVGAVLEEQPEDAGPSEAAPNGGAEGDDALYDMAVQIVARDRKCSTSYIQRKLAIGYNKAARLVELMEEQGVVSPANHVGKREILVPEPH
jgi:S-DNA-T family DNA segregation ATPase FtsK/SpoIIIE